MTKEKEFIYHTEDIMQLGTQLPLVAFSQMLKKEMPETDDAALKVTIHNYQCFIRDNRQDYDERDERALRKAFMKFVKRHPDLLSEYREMKRTIDILSDS